MAIQMASGDREEEANDEEEEEEEEGRRRRRGDRESERGRALHTMLRPGEDQNYRYNWPST